MDDDFEYTSSAVQQLTESLNRLISSNEAAAEAANARRDADEKATKTSKEKTTTENTANAALQKVVSTGKDVAREFMSIVDAGAKLSSTLGTTLTKGTQLELNNRLSLLGQLRSLDIDRMATMEQIQAAEKSFVDVFGAAREGMEISAQGATEFASGLKDAAGGNFTLTASAMQAMVTAGISGAEGLDRFKKSTGLANLSNERMTQLVNKNSLSFMLYGPRFAKAAQEAEKLGISLSQVQSAQESMVTNLDGTIDTVAQINQLGGQIDFGTLTRLNEFEGPEATLKYLQSTIPPALFQSASTRALLKGFGISVEDLMKGQESAQKTSSDRIEEQLTRLQEPVSAIANAMAGLGAIVEKLKNSFGPLIQVIGAFAIAMIGLRAVPFDKLGAGLTKLFPTLSKSSSFMGNISKPVGTVGKVVGGVGAGIFGAVSGFMTARDQGKDTYESAGNAAVQGTMAGIGTALGAIGGPIGMLIGGWLGNTLGKAMNDWFPEFGMLIGDSFKSLTEFISNLGLGESFSQLWETLKGFGQSLMAFEPVLKAVAMVLGLALVSAFDLIGFSIKVLITVFASAVDMINGALKIVTAILEFLGKGMDLLLEKVKSIPFVGSIATVVNTVLGNDVVAQPGYGERSLVTPDGTVALNNRDTVVAYADDMISGVRTLSLGSIAKNIQPAASDPTLITKINELIAVLQSSTTTINIDNKIQQVPRMVMAGVYSRNERV